MCENPSRGNWKCVWYHLSQVLAKTEKRSNKRVCFSRLFDLILDFKSTKSLFRGTNLCEHWLFDGIKVSLLFLKNWLFFIRNNHHKPAKIYFYIVLVRIFTAFHTKTTRVQSKKERFNPPTKPSPLLWCLLRAIKWWDIQHCGKKIPRMSNMYNWSYTRKIFFIFRIVGKENVFALWKRGSNQFNAIYLIFFVIFMWLLFQPKLFYL